MSAFALTPAADLTGKWSGFYLGTLFDDGDLACQGNQKINAEITQNGNNLTIVYTLTQVSLKEFARECVWTGDDDPEKMYGTIDGSRITVTGFSDNMILTGWYASSGIKLEGEKITDKGYLWKVSIQVSREFLRL